VYGNSVAVKNTLQRISGGSLSIGLLSSGVEVTRDQICYLPLDPSDEALGWHPFDETLGWHPFDETLGRYPFDETLGCYPFDETLV